MRAKKKIWLPLYIFDPSVMARVGAVKIEELMILAEVVTGEVAQHPDHAQKLQFSMVSVRVKVYDGGFFYGKVLCRVGFT